LEDTGLRRKYFHPYERLLYRVIRFDNKGFITGEESETCWNVYETVRQQLDTNELCSYAPGSRGPGKVFSLMRRDGRKWVV
jgi:glucose-6-phosphate 1-dehydrogenase